MKKSYFFKFFVFALVGALVLLPSCKDYDDDISGLETSVSSVKSDLTALQSTVSAAQSAATAAQSSATAAQATATEALAKANEALAAANGAGDAGAIEALEAEIAELEVELADLEDQIAAINAELEALEGVEARLEALINELETATDTQLDAIKADILALNSDIAAIEAQLAELGATIAPITSMTYIPTLVGDGGALPIIDFATLLTPCEYGIAPAQTLRFYVNPSNASEASIDKENLLVYHNAPVLRAATDAIRQSAEFVSLANGILTVKVDVDVNELGATPGTIDQILLEVLFVDGGSVKSDWIRVEQTEITNENLALVVTPLATGQTWASQELSTTLSAAQGLAFSDAPVVELEYDGTLDLATVVKTMTNGTPWADFNVEDYGLTYVFDIQNDDDEDLDADNQYIDLDGSVVTSKVFEVDGENPEAKDRMPIVHVRLYANEGVEDDECLILEGYVVIDLVAPCLDLGALQIDNYWDAAYEYTTHNVAVPDVDASDPALATYANNILNAFKLDETVTPSVLDLPYDGYSYEFIFAPAADQPLQDVEIDGVEYTFTVDATGTTLSVSADGGAASPVAIISGTTITYQENDLAKLLLNEGVDFMKAKLQLVVTADHRPEEPVCITLGNGKDTFDVVFLRPINVEGKAAENFIDGNDVGGEGSVIDLMDVVVLSDWRNTARGVETFNFSPDNLNYFGYYDVSDIEIDVDNIKPVGLTVNGVQQTTLPSTIVVTQTAATGDFNNPLPLGTLTYQNNGNVLNTGFTMIVPVSITYKWGVVETTVEVEVKPTSGNGN